MAQFQEPVLHLSEGMRKIVKTLCALADTLNELLPTKT